MLIMVLEVVLLLILLVVLLMLPQLLGESARGPLNPNHSTDTTVSTTPTLMDSEPTDPELPPTPALPLLTPKGLPKVSAARGLPKLMLTMVTTVTNFLGLPFVPPDSLPPPGELVLMVSTGVEKLSKPLLLKRSEFKTKKCKKP